MKRNEGLLLQAQKDRGACARTDVRTNQLQHDFLEKHQEPASLDFVGMSLLLI
jgi:hypothetical protein